MTTGNPIPEDKELFDRTTKLIYVGDDKITELTDCFGSQIPYDLRYGGEWCSNCGGKMIGEEGKYPWTCEFSETPDGAEADSGPWYCIEKEENNDRS